MGQKQYLKRTAQEISKTDQKKKIKSSHAFWKLSEVPGEYIQRDHTQAHHSETAETQN